jgi:hypothetical protein
MCKYKTSNDMMFHRMMRELSILNTIEGSAEAHTLSLGLCNTLLYSISLTHARIFVAVKEGLDNV